ncbi:hypothetical protein ACFQ3Z_03535 [Streptomyces nogalater]
MLATPGALPTVGTTLLFMAAQFTVYGIAMPMWPTGSTPRPAM